MQYRIYSNAIFVYFFSYFTEVNNGMELKLEKDETTIRQSETNQPYHL